MANPLDNLKPFDKESASEAGKKSSRAGIPNTKTRLKRLLELEQEITNPVTGVKENFTVAEQMDLAMISKARKGDVKAYNALLDRLEGKAQQSVDVNVSTDPRKEILDKYLGEDNAGQVKEA